MPALRILAIEDDPIFAESLKALISDIGFILIDVVDNVDEFKRLVRATVPDVLLLDIDLGESISGIDLAEEVMTFHKCPFIFITSHKDVETVRQALEVVPASYVTKPLDAASLLAAIELAKSKKSEQNNVANPTEKALYLKAGDVLKKIKEQEIQFVEIKGRVCHIQTGEGSHELSIRLKDLLSQLSSNFLQVHRSYVINLEQIDEVGSQLQHVQISNQQIPVGRNYKDELLVKINRIG
ncbi:LytR/AlgR family response regulator transcription factor [Marinoscillum sp.]|uniref:LytR/AlgR family response regulator transcription factor n=1 Tax=Marinoscillum sp. TaxID=2024838 RepID=UPI003BA8D950